MVAEGLSRRRQMSAAWNDKPVRGRRGLTSTVCGICPRVRTVSHKAGFASRWNARSAAILRLTKGRCVVYCVFISEIMKRELYGSAMICIENRTTGVAGFSRKNQRRTQNREAEKDAFFFVSEKINFGLSELHRTHDRPAMQTDQWTKPCGDASKRRSLRIKQQSPKVAGTGSAG